MYRLDQQDQVLARILEQTHKTNGRVTALEMKDAEQSGRRAGSGATTDWQLKLIAAFVGVAALATGIIPLVTK